MPPRPFCALGRYPASMTPPCEDATAYAAIPDEFLECIMSRRHWWPRRAQQHPQHVRLQYDRKTAVLELTEYRGTCEFCGTVRTLFRDRYSGDWMWAEYKYPDGYIAPAGTRWDPKLIRDEYDRRNPVKGRVKVVSR